MISKFLLSCEDFQPIIIANTYLEFNFHCKTRWKINLNACCQLDRHWFKVLMQMSAVFRQKAPIRYIISLTINQQQLLIQSGFYFTFLCAQYSCCCLEPISLLSHLVSKWQKHLALFLLAVKVSYHRFKHVSGWCMA